VGTIVALAAGLTLGLGLALTPLMMRVARRVGYIDQPGGHKSHESPTPYGGGLAIYLAAWIPIGLLLVAAFVAPGEWIVERFGALPRDLLGGVRDHGAEGLSIMVGGLVLLVLGLYDDLRPQGPLIKLATMSAAALLVATLGGVRIAEFLGTPASIVLTVAWIVIVVNTFNFLDNMDGLSAGVAGICAIFLIICGLMAGQLLVPALTAAYLGAILGFLVLNFPPARVFMGDAGSLQIGYMLAVASIMTSYWESGSGQRAFALAMPLVVLAVPLYDFVSVVVIRLCEGRNPLQGDQRHFSHRLVDRGLTRRQAVLTIYLATATTGLGATLLPNADLRTTITVLGMVVMVLLIVAILEAPLRKQV
jgi:UDP-GlcNAc:undecaprenyl-phosphate GlcNAc-1-phosphate transferase